MLIRQLVRSAGAAAFLRRIAAGTAATATSFVVVACGSTPAAVPATVTATSIESTTVVSMTTSVVTSLVPTTERTTATVVSTVKATIRQTETKTATKTLPPVTRQVTVTAQPPAPAGSVDNGTYLVGRSIQSGNFQCKGSIGELSTYWEVDSSSGDIMDNGLGDGLAFVSSDGYSVQLRGCGGLWERVD